MPTSELIGLAVAVAGITGIFVGAFVGYVVGRYYRSPTNGRVKKLREDIEYETEIFGGL